MNICYTITVVNQKTCSITRHHYMVSLSREKVQSPLWRQIAENFKRSFLNTVRNPNYTRSRIGQCFVSYLYFVLLLINPAKGSKLI